MPQHGIAGQITAPSRCHLFKEYLHQCVFSSMIPQYKSCFVMEKLRTAGKDMGLPEEAVVHFHTFESGEGKNESDSFGSQVKCAYAKGVWQRPDSANRSIEEVCDMIRENLTYTTEKYEFCEVQSVEPFDRVKKHPFIKLEGIQKMHHFTKTSTGSVLARDFSCADCIKLGGVCEDCTYNSHTVYTPPDVLDEGSQEAPLLDVGAGEDDGDGYVSENEADASFCDDDDGDGDEELLPDEVDQEREWRPGTCCWAKIRSYFPGRVCGPEDIPQQLKLLLEKQPSDENRVVWLFHPFSEHRIVRTRNLRTLGENREDRARAAKGDNFHEAYQQAVAVKNRDF